MSKKPATYAYHGRSPKKGTLVKLRQLLDGRYVVEFDNHPELGCVPVSAAAAVGVFAGWRERAARDWGASDVDWGDYGHLKRYWPEYVSPWDCEV